jgi:hypothetical protein
MDSDDCWAESKAKERVGQNFVKSILELSGYKVMNYGIENHNMQVIRMIKGNYSSKTNQRLMCMPDYVVVDPQTQEAKLVEVKYRQLPKYFNWKKSNFMFKYRTIYNYLEYWKDLTLIFALNVKPFCICVHMDDIDWNIHFKGKHENQQGHLDEIWNFTGLYKLINEVFPMVTNECFTKAKEISNF